MRSLFSVFVVAAVARESENVQDGINLLQVRATAFQMSNSTQAPEVCKNRPPPEGPTEFGCLGTAKANKVHWCHLWGEPHVTATFGHAGNPDHPDNMRDNRRTGQAGDYSATRQFDGAGSSGVLRLAKAADDSWEVQVFNCGLTLAGAAWRFGNTYFEVVVGHRLDPTPHFFVNGVKTNPKDLKGPLRNGGYVAATEATARFTRLGYKPEEFAWGICGDDPKKQISIDVDATNYGDSSKEFGNVLNILVHAARGSWEEDNTWAGCTWDEETRKMQGWKRLCHESTGDCKESLFRYTPQHILCQACKKPGLPYDDTVFGGDKSVWAKQWGRDPMCERMQPDVVPPDEACPKNNVSLAAANAACEHLKDEPHWFDDCVFDVCMTGSTDIAGNAENQEAEEIPQGKCADDSVDCDPLKLCCDAYDAGRLKFETVAQNNLDGSQEGPQELRYGSVLDGIDLRVTSVGNEYTNRNGNNKNGVNGLLGRINLDVGKIHPFNFSFVKAGTDELVSPGNVVISILDLDQGKKNKQRESVKVCDLDTSPVVSSNSELQVDVSGTCVTVTSTTKGTGEDNPDNPEQLADHHKARAVALPLKGKSSMLVELGISPKGRQNRDFLFSGTPTVACE